MTRVANQRAADDLSRAKAETETGESPEARIYGKIHQAIAEHRLLPGSRLVEDQLAEVFGVSRARIRSVLQALARDKVVTLHKNCGASITQPTVQEAREVFAARRLVEVALAREIVGAVDDKALKRLRAHVKKEVLAEKSRDRAVELRTSHDFHMLLAEIVGNDVITDFVQELLARSALITAIFERPNANVCSHISHGHLIELIEAGDAEGLANAMLGHLNEIESYLVLYEKEEAPVDLKDIFAAI